MTQYVESCLHNTDSTVRRLLRERIDETAATIEFRSCLQRCGPCFEAPFLVVDGELRTGDSHEALVETVTGETVTNDGQASARGNDGPHKVLDEPALLIKKVAESGDED